jgi:hypothetical protein
VYNIYFRFEASAFCHQQFDLPAHGVLKVTIKIILKSQGDKALFTAGPPAERDSEEVQQFCFRAM